MYVTRGPRVQWKYWPSSLRSCQCWLTLKSIAMHGYTSRQPRHWTHWRRGQFLSQLLVDTYAESCKSLQVCLHSNLLRFRISVVVLQLEVTIQQLLVRPRPTFYSPIEEEFVTITFPAIPLGSGSTDSTTDCTTDKDVLTPSQPQGPGAILWALE